MKKSNKMKRVLLISILTIGLISCLLGSLFSLWSEIFTKSSEKEIYTKELSELKEEEEYLSMEVEKLKDPDYVSRVARDQFLYSKDGEFNIRIK